MNTKKTSIIFLFCLLSTFLSLGTTLDSLGLKKENNKTYILYKLGPKQSLFSILKKYNLSLTEFKQVNPETDIPVKTGEIVYIPLHYLEESPSILKNIDKTVAADNNPAPNTPEKTAVLNDKKVEQYHIVKSKQGLLTIANLYKVSMADLRKWNNLSSDKLQEGQRLLIQEPNLDKTNLLPNKAEKTVTEAKIDMTIPAATDTKTAESSSSEGLKKTIENGIAELIDVPDNSGKYLALHKTAPIGTLVLVKNLANNQSIWVKVIGRLPNSDSKLIIKLSPKAFEKLNAVDKRIRAEISYLVQ
ncbi:LysM peptidoglycan-binding domain-containing protein [Aquirufa sp. ROCK2-A2]